LLYDDRGNLMSPSFTKKKGGQRYPCYVSQALLQNRRDMAGSVARVPAELIESAVPLSWHQQIMLLKSHE